MSNLIIIGTQWGDEGKGKGEASRDEIDMLGDVTNQIAGHTICAFGEGSSWPVQTNFNSLDRKSVV